SRTPLQRTLSLHVALPISAAWGLQAYPTSGLPSPSPGFALFRASCGETPVKLYASEEQLPPEIDPYFRGAAPVDDERLYLPTEEDRKSTRLNSSHVKNSSA